MFFIILTICFTYNRDTLCPPPPPPPLPPPPPSLAFIFHSSSLGGLRLALRHRACPEQLEPI